jgi:hypothetical protein
MKQIYLSLLIISNLSIAAQNNLNDIDQPSNITLDINKKSYKCSNYKLIDDLSGKNELEINLTNCSNLIDDDLSKTDLKYQANEDYDWIDHERKTTSPTAGI